MTTRLLCFTPRSRPFAPLMLATLLVGCSPDATNSGTSGGPMPVRPEPVVNEQMTHITTFKDAPSLVEEATLFRTTTALGDLDVRALGQVGDQVYAGTASGLFRFEEATSTFVNVPLVGAGAIVDFSVLGADQLVVARATEIQILTAAGQAGEVWSVPTGEIQSVAVAGADVYAGTTSGLVRVEVNGAFPIPAAQGFDVRDIVIRGNVVWMATPSGVMRYDLVAGTMLADLKAPAFLADDDVRALAWSGASMEILAATAQGLSRIGLDGAGATVRKAAIGDLPTADLRAVSAEGAFTLLGHGIGVTRLFAQTSLEHWHSLRWLPAEEVTSVLATPTGAFWIGTHAGISRIARKPMSLADKAAYYEPLVEKYWRMDGFVDDSIEFADPWDQSTTPTRGDKDNDGLWTQLQMGAWCFAYAKTKDEAYYEKAKKAMAVMKLLVEVPGETFVAHGMDRGFTARSLVRDDEGTLFDSKKSLSNWHEQAYNGHTYFWKDDTSSDEYVGHYFGTPIYYDLCAKTDEERKEIADRMHRAMSYIIDHGYVLIDLDGQGTTFGYWNDLASAVDGIGPCLASGKPNCAASYGGEGWLNSIEILGHLLATWHITGDPKFYDEYERLVVKERYGEMVMPHSETFTLTSHKNRNHSDHELAILSYYTLLRYEPNAERRAQWLKSLQFFYDYEKPERNALEIAIMTSAMADVPVVPDATRTLSEWPLDMREWLYDNAHRKDIALDGVDRFDKPQFAGVLPYDEMRTFKWNGNPYAVSGGGNGASLQAPWPWLLPYWMMRYNAAIE